MFLAVILVAAFLIPTSSGYLGWAWRVEPTLDRSEYEPGSKGTIDESVINTGPTILNIYATVIMFDWQKQSGTHWSMNVNVEVSPGQQVPLAKLAFEIPANVTPGKHAYEIGLRHRHLGLREGWQDDGLQWYPSTYDIYVSKSSFRLDLVATAMSPKSEEGLYIGDVSTATFTLKNSGGTAAKQVRVAIEEIKTGIISLVESTPAKDLEAGATGQWMVKVRAEKAGETTSRARIYVSENRIHDSELRIVVVEPTLEIVSVSKIPEEGKPIYPGEILTATFTVKNRMRSTVREVSISAEIPSGVTLVETSQPISIDQDSMGQLTLKIRAGNPGRYDASLLAEIGDNPAEQVYVYHKRI